MIQIASLTAIAFLALAACSPGRQEPSAIASETADALPDAASDAASEGAADAPAPSARPPADVLGLEGLGALRIGQPVPGGSTWGEHGAQTSESCRTISSPDYPGVYAIVRGGVVRRITLGGSSTVKLAEGIGVGATEKQVRAWFGGFREEPHKYEAPPAKYLTAPNAGPGEPALRFEIGQDRRVALIHVGEMPELAYVEGCA